MNKPEKKSSSNKSATESESTFKDLDLTDAVSYTHLTLPTNREV